jgi:hypothetical protein
MLALVEIVPNNFVRREQVQDFVLGQPVAGCGEIAQAPVD